MELSTRRARPADRKAVVDALATAFADDPVTRWLCATPRNDRRMLDLHLRLDTSYADVAIQDDTIVGAALWQDPQWHESVWRAVRGIPLWAWALGPRIRRGDQLLTAFAKARPERPYLYLATVGAALRGHGVGTALLERGLDGYDGRAYLESSKGANIPLYERFGFRVTGEIALPDGPKLWPMVRG